MIKNTPVFLILWLCFIVSPLSHAQFAAVYRQCLQNERDKADQTVRDACAQDAAMLSNPGMFGECVNKTHSALLSTAVRNRCREEAEKSHYTPEQLKAHEDARKREEAVRTGRAFVSDEPESPVKPTEPKKETPPKEADAGRPATTPPPASPPKNPTEPTPAPDHTATVAEAENEAAEDIAACERSQSKANQCCNNPMSCAGSMNASDQRSLANLFNNDNGGGLSDACQSMNALANNYGNVNSGLSAVCASAHNACTNVCGQLVSKYSTRISSCTDCPAQSVYESAHSTLSSRNSNCQSMRSRSDQLQLTGLSTANNRSIAEHCTRQAAQLPNPIAPAQGIPTSGTPLPTSFGSPVAANQLAPTGTTRAIAGGGAGFRDGGRVAQPSDFNVDQSTGFKGYNSKQSQTQAPVGQTGALGNLPGAAGSGKIPVVANNSGGSIPGQGGENRPASLGPAGSIKPQAPGANQTTDIDRGFQGANGYSQSAGSGGSGRDGERGGYQQAALNDRRIAGNDDQFEQKIDLRQFLPGGSRAAARSWGNNQINKKEENLFLLISNKMIEKCRLGILWQCQ